MYFVKQLGITLVTLLALAATSTGQTLTVTSGPLTVGSQASISYSNPALAGQEIIVEINDCGVTGATDTIRIQLDETGNGTGTWTVLAWDCAILEAPGAPASARSIQP